MPSRPSIRPLSDDVRFETVRRRSTTEPPVKRDASVAVRPATPSTTRFHPFKNRFRSFLQSSLPRITSVTTLPAFSGPKRPAKQPTSFTFGLSSVHQFDRRIQTSHTSIARISRRHTCFRSSLRSKAIKHILPYCGISLHLRTLT